MARCVNCSLLLAHPLPSDLAMKHNRGIMCFEPGACRVGVGDAEIKAVKIMQQPEEDEWCICEVCGLRIPPVVRKRSGKRDPKPASY